MVELLHHPKEMADTVAYSCTLPLKAEYHSPGSIPYMYKRQDFACRDGSQNRHHEALLELPQLGFRAFVKNRAIVRVQCDLPKLIFGHNGRLIRSQDQVELALDRIESLLKLVATPTSSLGGMVPGRPVHEHVHFTRIDFAWQFPDPEMRLATMLRQAVHPGVRRQNLQYANGSTIPGTSLCIKAYEKASQLGIATEDRYLRLEVEFKGDTLRKRLNGDKAERVLKLDFMSVYQVYRETVLELDRPTVAVRDASVAEALAQLQLSVPDQDILTPWLGMRFSSSRSARRFRKEYNAALQSAAGFRFADLLPVDRLPPLHELEMKTKEDRLFYDYVQRFDWPTGPEDPLFRPPSVLWYNGY